MDLKVSKRNYNKLIKKYKKELRLQAKKAAPWDWGFMFDAIRTYIEFMADYYNQDYNIAQAKESQELIKKSLNKCLAIYHELDMLDNSLPDCKLIVDNTGAIAFEYPDSTEEEYIKISSELADREQELYKALFDTIRDNFQTWWD